MAIVEQEHMQTKNDIRKHNENFKRAAVDFLQKNGGSVESAADELGVPADELREWSRKVSSSSPAPKDLSGIARLKAENEALRNEILQLQVQWDILKATLSVLSSSV